MLCILLVALSLGQTPAAADSVGRISGRVTLEGANTPIAGVRVTLFPGGRPSGPIGPPPQTLTDEDGRFAFDRVAPGAYRIDVQRTGYAPPDQSRTPPLQVAAGQTVDGIEIRMQKGAVIVGKVLDPTGEPLTDARVMILRRMPMPAGAARGLPPMPRLIPVPSPGAQTNDLGEFRVSGLAPGEYFVAASPPSIGMFGTAGSSPVRDRKAARSTFPTTYYPGTSDQASAQPIAVAAGAEVNNIIFTMQSVPAFRVSGVVVDEDGKPVGDAMVVLMSDPRIGGAMGPVGSALSRPDGQFDIDDVPAGSYRANASIVMRMTGASGGGGAVAGGSSFSSWSSTSSSASGGNIQQPADIVVTDADVTGARVVVRRPAPR